MEQSWSLIEEESWSVLDTAEQLAMSTKDGWQLVEAAESDTEQELAAPYIPKWLPPPLPAPPPPGSPWGKGDLVWVWWESKWLPGWSFDLLSCLRVSAASCRGNLVNPMWRGSC